MTPQQIVGMAVKLFAIWLVVIAFQVFTAAMALKTQLGNSTSASALYFMPALPLLMAMILWLFPMTIAHKLVPRTLDTSAIRVPARDLAAVASIIIGIWVLIGAIPLVVSSIGLAFFSDNYAINTYYFTQERKLHLLGTALQCALALFLVLRPWSVANKVLPHSSDTSRVLE